MGGNLFKLGRKPRAQYLEIEAQVLDFLGTLLGVEEGYRVPRYYGEKADFGDLDVVISDAAVAKIGGREAFEAAIRDGLGVSETKNVGHVYSTVFCSFQVDYFIRPAALLDPTYHYLSFNDLGNLIGKIYRRLGFKYGENGLSYVFRRTQQESYKRELLVSRDWPRILAQLELDVAAWEAGFHSLEDMFEWVSASPYFSVAPYEDLSRSTERRAKVRRTMTRFLAWLESSGLDKRYAYSQDREAYVPWAAAAFPEAELEQALARERELEARDASLRAKFSGSQVREWTGLDGKALGGFLRDFGRSYPSERLFDMSPEQIREAVLAHAATA